MLGTIIVMKYFEGNLKSRIKGDVRVIILDNDYASVIIANGDDIFEYDIPDLSLRIRSRWLEDKGIETILDDYKKHILRKYIV